jgi:MFS family permease
MSLRQSLSEARAPFAAFAAMGVLWGGFAAIVPDLMVLLAVDEARMGRLMFLTPVAAVSAMLLAPMIGAGLGRVALPVAALFMALAFALPGHASAPLIFVLFMMGCGFGTGLTDVLMNARVAEIENVRGHPLMNLCHAAYSFGYAASAILTGVLRQAGWTPAEVMGSFAALAVLGVLFTIERDGRIDGLRRPKDRADRGLGPIPVIGGAMILIAFLTENAAEYWSALHIEQTLGGNPAEGAFGPALIALTMGIARLFGQGLAERISAVTLLTGGAGIAAGALIAGMAINPPMAYAGFIIMGIGSSVIAPTAFSLVGRLAAPEARARAIARATLLGYFGYFVGPPLVGMIAGHLGLPFAFVFAAVMLGTIPILARVLRRHDQS